MQAAWWQREMLWSPGQWGTVGRREGWRAPPVSRDRDISTTPPGQQGQWQKQADENEVGATANTGEGEED